MARWPRPLRARRRPGVRRSDQNVRRAWRTRKRSTHHVDKWILSQTRTRDLRQITHWVSVCVRVDTPVRLMRYSRKYCIIGSTKNARIIPTNRAEGNHVQIGTENAICNPRQMNSGAAAQIATHNEVITTDRPVISAEVIFEPGCKLLGEGMYTSQPDGTSSDQVGPYP